MRITKQFVTTDPRGKVIAYNVEHLSDDGRGRTTVVNRTIQARCRGCCRSIAVDDASTGLCDCCGRGKLCGACTCVCQVCSRRCCRRCRRGFVWGRTPINACPGCFARLNRRARYEQYELARRNALQASMMRQQARLREQAMRLQMLRMSRSTAHAVRR